MIDVSSRAPLLVVALAMLLLSGVVVHLGVTFDRIVAASVVGIAFGAVVWRFSQIFGTGGSQRRRTWLLARPDTFSLLGARSLIDLAAAGAALLLLNLISGALPGDVRMLFSAGLALAVAAWADAITRSRINLLSLPSGVRILISRGALHDGRIVDLWRAGYFNGTPVVPDEATLGDDPRARHYLAAFRALAEELRIDVAVEQPGDRDDVDIVVVEREGETAGEGPTIIALDQIATTLQPALRAGDRIRVTLSSPGQKPRQALARLDDGMPVVVSGAADRLGQRVSVQIDRVIQRVDGRIAFAQLLADESQADRSRG